jgi:hypothetical protein
MDNRRLSVTIPPVSVPPLYSIEPDPAGIESARQTGDAIRQWAREMLEGAKTSADLRHLLEKVLTEVRRAREDQIRGIDPRWLKVDQARRYLGGMSETWIRDLEKVAPRGLFHRVRGTVFIDRQMLDRVMEGDIELDEL